MARKIVAVRPADLNPDEVKYYEIGTLLINTLEGDLYVVLDKDGNGVKKPYLVGGSAKYEILHHASLSHVIQDFSPVKYDHSTVWYNTKMMYVEPTDSTNASNAYITVRAELSPGVFGWKTILPISSAKNVYITKKEDGSPYTLQNYIDDHKKILISPPSVEEAERGEIYIKEGDNTLWWKTGPNEEDQVILGDANPYCVEKLKKSIHIMQDHPANWDPQSLWLKEGTDANIVDSLSTLVYTSDPTFIGGLMFKTSTNKTAVVRTGYNKVATIDLNNTQETGFQLFDFEFGDKMKYYMELNIKDPYEKLQLLFFNKRPADSLVDFGNQLDQASMYISTTKRKLGGVEYNQVFNWDRKTIFIMIDGVAKKLSLGFVLDDGTLKYVYTNITYITKFMGIGSGITVKANAMTTVKINSFKVSDIPLGYRGLNNTLPGETAFSNVAPVTNAQSVFLEENKALNALHQGGGRLITTPRDYLNKNSAVAGELMTDYTDEILWAKKPDGTLFKIGGGNDNTFIKHINNSLMVVHGDLDTFQKEDDNLAKMYVSEGNVNIDKHKADGNVIYGTFGMIDNSPDGNGEYKMMIPYTDTETTHHKWIDIRSGTNKEGAVKLYLDDIYEILRDNLKTKFVYRGYDELITENDLITRFNTKGLFLSELKQNNTRFSKNAIYLQSIKKKGSNNIADRQDLTILYDIFNVPADGNLVIYKDDKNQLYITLFTEDGIQYYGDIQGNYSILWNKNVIEKNGVVSLNSDIYTSKGITSKSVTADEIKANNKLETSYILSEGEDILKSTVDSVTGKQTITLANDNNFYSVTKSKERPTWEQNSSLGKKVFKYAMLEDVANGWNFKGYLSTDDIDLVDLNTLNDTNNVGYYILNEYKSSVAMNYPGDLSSGYLYVMKSKNDIIQTFVSDTKTASGNSKIEYCIRYYRNDKWTKWSKTLTKEDLTNFYEKTGGPISGNVSMERNLEVKGRSTLNGDITITNTLNMKTTDNKSVIKSENVSGDLYLTQGDYTKYTRVGLASSKVPQWVTEVTNPDNTKSIARYDFALAKDVKSLATNTYTTKQVDEKIAAIDFGPLERAIAGKLSKSGDTGTGDYNFTNGKVTIDKLTVANGTFNMPTVALNSNSAYSNLENDLKTLLGNEKLSKGMGIVTNLYTSTGLKPNTGVTTLVFSGDMTQTQKPNDRISSVLLNVSKDDGICVGTLLGNNPNSLSFKRLVERADIVDNLTSIESTKVLSANQGRLLYSLDISRYRGLLSAYYPGNGFDKDKLFSLEPGNYQVTSDDDLVRLGLDKDKISNTGNLAVFTSNTTNGKCYTYIPYTDKTIEENTMAFMNMTSQAVAKWIYIKDYSLFVDKKEMTRRQATLRKQILGYIVSNEYTYTGNTTNDSIPYRLVHTHNHDGTVTNNNTKLQFFTNIDLSENGLNSEDATVQIKIRGFSYSDVSPIEIIATINIRNKSNIYIEDGRSDITYLTPGGIDFDVFIDGATKKLCFSIFSDQGHYNLSFDTYIRLARVGNYNFSPKITKWKYENGAESNSTVVDLDTSRYLFTNA